MEIRRRLGERLEFVSWYESSGLEKEPELAQIRKMGVVSEDGVHLSDMYCGNIAVNLCYRVATAEVQMIREPKSGGECEPGYEEAPECCRFKNPPKKCCNKINIHI